MIRGRTEVMEDECLESRLVIKRQFLNHRGLLGGIGDEYGVEGCIFSVIMRSEGKIWSDCFLWYEISVTFNMNFFFVVCFCFIIFKYFSCDRVSRFAHLPVNEGKDGRDK